MDRLYFAYGSNMNPAQMRFRCPTSKAVARATLRGYRFAINSRGVATIVESEKSSVSGVLWKISRLDEEVLDCFEGVRSGAYVKRRISPTKNCLRRLSVISQGMSVRNLPIRLQGKTRSKRRCPKSVSDLRIVPTVRKRRIC